MTKSGRRNLVAGLLYFTAAVVTFGHSAAGRYALKTADHRACQEKEKRDPRVICFDDAAFEAASSGMTAAILWPLYWSWEAQAA